MTKQPRAARTALVVGRPAHIPKPVLVDDPAKIRRLLARALNERECSLRVKVGSVLFSLRVLDAEFKGATISLEWRSAFSRAASATLASPPRDALCTWLVLAGGRGALGFRAAVLDPGRGRARIESPSKLVYVQKREELRYHIPAGYELTAILKESPRASPVTARIHDLSASGISVLVHTEQLSLKPRKISFRVHGRAISADVAPIASSRSSGRSPGGDARTRPFKRLRFRFVDLPESDQDLIRMFVVDHLVSLDVDSEA